MWSKLCVRGHGQQARVEPSAEVKPVSGVSMPLSLPGDDEIDEVSASHSINSVEEHFGLFPIESTNCPNTYGPAILESVSHPPTKAGRDPTDCTDSSIIAVHGLGGGWQKTWTAKNGSMWLRDFLPQQLDAVGLKARTWSYGYDSRTAFSAAVTDITDEAGMFLDRIQGERITHEDKSRRIVFVAHSLGGILVKKVRNTVLVRTLSCGFAYCNNDCLFSIPIGYDSCTGAI